jgi:hypothetical protein
MSRNEQQREHHTEHDWQMYGGDSEQYEKHYQAQYGTDRTPPSCELGLPFGATDVDDTATRRLDCRASCQ